MSFLSADPSTNVTAIIQKIGEVKKKQVGLKVKTAQIKRQQDQKKSTMARVKSSIALKQQQIQKIKK